MKDGFSGLGLGDGWVEVTESHLVHCEQATVLIGRSRTRSGGMLKAKFLGSSWPHHRQHRCTLPVADLLQPNLQPISGHTHSRDSL